MLVNGGHVNVVIRLVNVCECFEKEGSTSSRTKQQRESREINMTIISLVITGRGNAFNLRILLSHGICPRRQRIHRCAHSTKTKARPGSSRGYWKPLLFKGREMPLLPTAVDRKSCSAITTTTRTRKWLCNPVHSPFWLSVCLSVWNVEESRFYPHTLRCRARSLLFITTRF